MTHSLFLPISNIKSIEGEENKMDNYLLISDAAKAVCVESHVLRYWEEELQLPIKRNELGHRYYTKEDVERFKNIKDMKERGLQLKAIKMILKNGRLDMLSDGENESAQVVQEASRELQEAVKPLQEPVKPLQRPTQGTMAETREEKAQRLQWIMQQMIKQAVRENNEELVQRVKESVIKELDYQFRMQEERDEERARIEAERSENYYRKMDELLRKKSSRRSVKELVQRKNHAEKGKRKDVS